jgi:AraC family transcriptional regulator
MPNHQTKKEYIGRISAVILYINEHLDEELPLYQLARIACFSPFHFHRIFSSITGETLNSFVNRKRLEKIASQLLQGTEESLSSLAYSYGFKNASTFSRSFRKFYGISPTEFKEEISSPFSKIGQVDSKNGQDKVLIEKYLCSIDNNINWLIMNAQIEVKEMPSMKVAYIDHVGPFDEIGKVYGRLFQWAGPRALLNDPELKTITVYHDDPKVTDISKVRQSAGIVVKEDIAIDREVAKMEVSAGKFAVGRFEITAMEFTRAWDSMCIWVAEKGYKSTDGHYYELYHNDHEQHPEKKFIVDICIPVS